MLVVVVGVVEFMLIYWSLLHSLKAVRTSVMGCSSFKSGEDLGPGMHCHSKPVRAYALERLDVQKQ